MATEFYLVVCDYFLKWIEVLLSKTSCIEEVIEKLQKLFVTFGISEIVFAGNVPFNSREFQKFAQEWNFCAEFHSPNFPQSNGQAQKAVNIAKLLLKKSAGGPIGPGREVARLLQ